MRRCTSAPGMAHTQAQLLRGRGDLGQARGRFDAQLPKTRAIVRLPASKPGISRIGMDVVTSKERPGLIVADIDKSPFGKTPVAVHNCREQRQAVRSEEEKHASLTIQPGDRIRNIRAEAPDKSLKDLSAALGQEEFDGKKTMSNTAMLAELAAATSETSPRCVNLQVSRNLEDVLRPLINSGGLDASQKFSAPETNLTKPAAKVESPAKPPAPSTPLRESTPSISSRVLQQEGLRLASPCVFNMSDDELFSTPTKPPQRPSTTPSFRSEADPIPHVLLGKRVRPFEQPRGTSKDESS